MRRASNRLNLLIFLTACGPWACTGGSSFGGKSGKGAPQAPAPAVAAGPSATPGPQSAPAVPGTTATTPGATGTTVAPGECQLFTEPRFDPAGPHGSEGSPKSAPVAGELFDRTLGGDATTLDVSSDGVGTISGHKEGSLWCLRSLEGEGANSGPLATAADGRFAQKVPLFCGKQLLNLGWLGEGGKPYVVTYVVDRQQCEKGGLRLTLAWGAGARDFELHLIRQGGVINNNGSDHNYDCTWTSCLDHRPDWGKSGDPADDPRKDVDWTGESGTENIFLTKLEDVTYDVYVEYWADGAPLATRLVVNAFGQTSTHDSPVMKPKDVWHAGTIDAKGQKLDLKSSIIPCAGSWQGGCQLKLPP